MGCHVYKQQDKISESTLQLSGQKVFYDELCQKRILVTNTQYSINKIQGRVILLYWRLLQETLQLSILDLKKSQQQEFILPGHIKKVVSYQECIIILTKQYLYRLQMVNDRISIVKKIRFELGNEQLISILFISMNLILVTQQPYVYMIKLGDFDKLKKIFKLYINIEFTDFWYYNLFYDVLIFGDFDNLYILDIKSKLYRYVQLRRPSQTDFIVLKYVKIVENNIEVILAEDSKKLYLVRLNYHDYSIQSYRYLSYDCDIIDENYSLTLYKKEMFLQLDKDYNVQQKFYIHLNQDKQQYRIRLSCNQSHLFIIYEIINSIFENIRQSFEEETEIEVYKQNQNMNNGQIWIRDIKDYRADDAWNGEISQNQLYLATLKEESLLFYVIQSNIEIEHQFSDCVNNSSFSSDSNQLCVTCYDFIIYYKCQQGLKKRYQLFFNQNEKVIIGRYGIDLIQHLRKIRVISQKSKKLIFTIKFPEINTNNLDYCPFSGIIMISKPFSSLSIAYQIHDFKFIKINEEDKINFILVQKTKQLMIINLLGQLELWSLNNQGAIQFKQMILQNVCNFIKGSPNAFYFMGSDNRILGLNHKLKLTEEIQYDHSELTPIQVMENYILCKNYDGITLVRRT